jgi:hypothetical protein
MLRTDNWSPVTVLSTRVAVSHCHGNHHPNFLPGDVVRLNTVLSRLQRRFLTEQPTIVWATVVKIDLFSEETPGRDLTLFVPLGDQTFPKTKGEIAAAVGLDYIMLGHSFRGIPSDRNTLFIPRLGRIDSISQV